MMEWIRGHFWILNRMPISDDIFEWKCKFTFESYMQMRWLLNSGIGDPRAAGHVQVLQLRAALADLQQGAVRDANHVSHRQGNQPCVSQIKCEAMN